MTCGWIVRGWGSSWERRGVRSLLVLLGLCGLPVEADTPNYLLFLDEGVERLAGGDWEGAKGLLEAASRVDPQDPLSYLGRGYGLLASGKVGEAAPFFRRAAELGNAPAEAAYGLGLCYLLRGHADPAQAFFYEALEQDPDLTSAQTYLALLETLAGESDRAREHLQQARARGGAPALLNFIQVVLEYRQGRWAELVTALSPEGEGRERDGGGETGRGPLSEIENQGGEQDDLAGEGEGLWEPLPLRLSFTEESELELLLMPSDPPSEEVAPLAEPPPSPAPPPPPSDRPYFQNLVPAQVVQGEKLLRVHVPSGLRADFVSFSVDGECVSVTNVRPYCFRWDTTLEEEGRHTLAIQTEGTVVLEYHLEVIVQNQGAELYLNYDPAVCRDLAQRFSRVVKVAPPSFEADQVRLHAALRSGQYAEATRLCEAALARSWQRHEVLPLLLNLYARTGRSQPVAEVRQPYSGTPGGKRVALTFDDGPNIPYTGQLLKLLDEYDAHATFLVVGRRAEQYPYLVREIAAHGHEIGNHSYSHRRMKTSSEEEILLEVLRTEWIVRQAGAPSVRLFRPPGGHSSENVRAALARLGYTLVFWTINGGGFKHLPPAEAAQQMIARTTDGAIFLLHNGPDNTLEILPDLLRQLQAHGFRCVTVSEILQPPVPETADFRLPMAD